MEKKQQACKDRKRLKAKFNGKGVCKSTSDSSFFQDDKILDCKLKCFLGKVPSQESLQLTESRAQPSQTLFKPARTKVCSASA